PTVDHRYLLSFPTRRSSDLNVFIADPLSDDGIFPLRQETELNLNIIVDTGLAPEELIARIADVDVLLVRSQTTVTREVIEAAKKDRKSTRLNSSHVKISYAV